MKKAKIFSILSLFIFSGITYSVPTYAQNISNKSVTQTDLAVKWTVMQAKCKGAVLPFFTGAVYEALPWYSLGQWILDEKTGFYDDNHNPYYRRKSLKEIMPDIPIPLFGGVIGTGMATIWHGFFKAVSFNMKKEDRESLLRDSWATLQANWSHTQGSHEKWFGKNSACNKAELDYLYAQYWYQKNSTSQQAVATGSSSKKVPLLKSTTVAPKRLAAKSKTLT